MRRWMTTALLTALVAGTALALPAQAAAPTVDLQPQELARGADIAVPHIEDGDFVDGTRRVELPGTVARVIGEVDDGWLVAHEQRGSQAQPARRTRRGGRDGRRRPARHRRLDGHPLRGRQHARVAELRRRRSQGDHVRRDADDGSLIGEKGPGRYVSLLDVDADRVILGRGHARAAVEAVHRSHSGRS